MIDLADAEAAHLGNIASTCIRRGAIPPVSLRPLWFTNRGKCIGLRIIGHDDDEFDLNGEHDGTDYLDPLFPIVQHLKAYAGEVVETEGVEWLLYEWQHTRDIYHEMYPAEDPDWATAEQGARIVGRSVKTLNDWRREGFVEVLDDGLGETLYSLSGLQAAVEAMKNNEKKGGRPRLTSN